MEKKFDQQQQQQQQQQRNRIENSANKLDWPELWYFFPEFVTEK
ncbi:hypothetical protein DERF_004584 [Dermatophagoides farinae]|uniref:Uncharacterized protein n=1 Tax=Dermatophagoides farinae TaxID=6954 RepID=A0A922I476_DERFA|nr:hypothetical protein DERF_004584 [Dermatophagoides farinae]